MTLPIPPKEFMYYIIYDMTLSTENQYYYMINQVIIFGRG